ncbi:MAG: DUF1707 domain-containing protein [Streptosporangiales bacterium]|nr:DUF1707 domain-containing protein [Streptosporangiales bacterium]
MNRWRRNAGRDLRASDADREGVVAALSGAYGEGRLTVDEHQERMESAYAARTLGDLADLLADLPGAVGEAGLPDFADGPLTATFGRRGRTGRWVLPGHYTANAIGGTVTLDLTEAVLAADPAVVTAVCLGGFLQVLVPPWIRVEVERGRLVGLRRVWSRRASAEPTSTVVVRAFGIGQVTVRTLKARPRR